MKPGDVIRMTQFEHHFSYEDRRGRVGYKAQEGRPKKGEPRKVFIAVLLGMDDLDNPKLDPGAVLQAMGWTPPEDDNEPDPPAPGREKESNES